MHKLNNISQCYKTTSDFNKNILFKKLVTKFIANVGLFMVFKKKSGESI